MLICRVVDESLACKIPVFKQLSFDDLLIELDLISIVWAECELQHMILLLLKLNFIDKICY